MKTTKTGSQPGTQSPKPQSKPRVWIHYSAVHASLEAMGDTYPVKEHLKALGFRWQDGAWVKSNVKPGEIPGIIGELGKVADVAVTPLKDAVEALARTIELISTVSSRVDGDLAKELEGVQAQINDAMKRLRGLQERVDKKLLGG
jgi:hypothetical protein